MCRGLIDHDDETDEIFFSHTSIRDFLCAEDTANSEAWFNLRDTKSARQHLLVKCLTYLLFDEFQVPCSDKTTLDTRLRSYPLLEHAAKTWPEYFGHGDLVESQVEKALRLMDSRKASGGQYASWIQVLTNDVPANVSLTTEPLYYAASFGLLPLVEHLVKRGATVDAPGGRAQATPLQMQIRKTAMA
ncbi:hypothetical protein FOMG_19942 [Fusarium oxysporum f. sp. melonis 26406]|uniref:Uncharacterized protein n=1 Tax=Fusarium oxysporum f. sp. melonis 26406 TaxID=1089452 RepID=W9YVR7_FUSOX|nr:hypothetical protein FOMG_19942 [Fusarium oxysporum f. sp. melonis 26406]